MRKFAVLILAVAMAAVLASCDIGVYNPYGTYSTAQPGSPVGATRGVLLVAGTTDNAVKAESIIRSGSGYEDMVVMMDTGALQTKTPPAVGYLVFSDIVMGPDIIEQHNGFSVSKPNPLAAYIEDNLGTPVGWVPASYLEGLVVHNE